MLLVEELPRNPTGKVVKGPLREATRRADGGVQGGRLGEWHHVGSGGGGGGVGIGRSAIGGQATTRIKWLPRPRAGD